MDLALPTKGLEKYHSGSQIARVATEAWAAKNLFCVGCQSSRLRAFRAGTKARDYFCPNCDVPVQLKSQSRPFGRRIVDSAYESMMAAIASDHAPHFVLLHYTRETWSVVDLTFIPNFAIPESAIEKRKPLSPTAERANWVGCNVLLCQVPIDARIPIVENGRIVSRELVRRALRRIRPLAELKSEQRGWTLDVLTAVRQLERSDFLLGDVYAKETELSRLHPSNRHVRDKIRQQLQVLRDKGLLEFLGGGRYRLVD